MTELSMRKEEDREGSQLLLLQGFLRERNEGNILSKIKGMRLKEALEKVVEIGSDKLVLELLKEHPWVLGETWILGERYVAWAIAEYRGDEVTMYMLKEHPEVLDKHVARAIAENRSDKVVKDMIDKYPKVLEYEFVAWAIAEYRGDKLVKHMIDNYPEVRKQVAYVIAEHRSGKLVTRLLKEHPELDKHVARAIAENRTDKLIKYMIDNYPEVLEDFVVWSIAKYRSYELLMYMINKQPETLKYEYVVKTVIEHGGVEAIMNLINEHPEVLKYEYVAMEIVEHRSDKEIIHIIDNLINRQPNILGTERLTCNLAFANKSELLTYILFRLGEIKPDDVELTTLQFSVMLRELGYYYNYKEIVVKQIFLDRKAIGYRKELNSMGPLYLALLDLLNVSKESAERLAKELSKAEGNVRKALPLRGLAYALSHRNDSELNLFIEKSRSVMNDLIMFPTVCELKYAGIISSDEFRQVSDSIDKEAKLYALLAQKVEHAFNVKLKSDDARNAILDRNFLEDLFGLSIKYHKYNKQAESVLINAIKRYFEDGIEGFKKFKFGHKLAMEQLSDAYPLRDTLMNLDKLVATYTGKRCIPYNSIENEIYNFMQHKWALLINFGKIEQYAENELLQIARSAKSPELAELLMSKDLDRLTSPASQVSNPDDERWKAKGIALIKVLKAGKSFNYIDNIVVELQKMAGKSKEEQDLIMEETAKKVAEWVDNGGLQPLGVLRNYISKINNELGISDKDLYNAKSALDNAKSIIDILLNYSKSVEGAVTAQITFDPSKILTFGRYGSSGSGNCQNSKGSVELNQSLMSMLGDANQFMIIFYKAGDTKPLGFMQVHLLKSDKGMIFFMERPYTNEPNMTTAMKGAAKMLAQKIKSETGFDCYTYCEVGDKPEKLEVRIPSSPVPRYIDFTRALKGPESFTYEISAKCLTSDPLFGLKR